VDGELSEGSQTQTAPPLKLCQPVHKFMQGYGGSLGLR